MIRLSKDDIKISALKIEKWVFDHHYKGYDPSDGLSSILRPLAFKNQFYEQILQQTIRRSAINFRPLLQIKPEESTKGRGYMAWGYVNLYKIDNELSLKQKNLDCLEWLDKNKSPFYTNHAWGNHFDYVSRSGNLPKFEPTIVWTSLIGHAFIEAYNTFGDNIYLEVVKNVAEWIKNLPREKTNNGVCLSYVNFKQLSVHNSNMLGAGFLARYASIVNDDDAIKLARSAIQYSCFHQLENGAWYYGPASNLRWIDNFHTAYNLDSLKYYTDYTGDEQFVENLNRGYKFWKTHFFDESGLPFYYHNKKYPIDIQCASQAIDTFTLFSVYDSDALEMALKVAKWTIDNMQDKNDGHIYFRMHHFGYKSKVPLIHWAQATTFKALSFLLTKL